MTSNLMTSNLSLSLQPGVQGCGFRAMILQEDERPLMSSEPRVGFQMLEPGLQARIFSFLDVTDIAKSVLNRSTREVSLGSLHRKNLRSLQPDLQAKIFSFLDIKDIAKSVVNKSTQRASELPSLHREKLRQMNRAVFENLKSLADLGFQVDWRASLQEETMLQKLRRQVRGEENRMVGLRNAERMYAQGSRERFELSLHITKAVIWTFFALLTGLERRR